MGAVRTVTTVATIVCLALAAVVVVRTGVQALRDRAADTAELATAGVLEIGVLGYVGARIAELVGGHRPPSVALAVAYLVGIALVMPVAAALGVAERSRWGPLVIGAGAIVVAVLFARIDQVWAHG